MISTPSLVQVEVVGGPPLVRASRVNLGLLPVNREPEPRAQSHIICLNGTCNSTVSLMSHRAKNCQFISPVHWRISGVFKLTALVCIILTLSFMFIRSPHPSIGYYHS